MILNHFLCSPVAREWIARQRESIRPWNLFIDQEKFSKPQTPQQISERLQKNIKFFQSNYKYLEKSLKQHNSHKNTENSKFWYLVVVLILAGYCLITSPLLIIALGAFFGVQFVQKVQKRAKIKNSDDPNLRF